MFPGFTSGTGIPTAVGQPLPNFAGLGGSRNGLHKRTTDSLAGHSKRTRVETPSKVLFVQGLPPDCAEEELRAIGRPFGVVEEVLPLTGKQQGFIQMESVEAATRMLETYSARPYLMRGGSPLFLQYSNKPNITRKKTDAGEPDSSTEPSPVLLVSFSNVMFPITLHVIHEVFSKYGEIKKIFMFQRLLIKCLIQFGSIEAAANAKAALDKMCIYDGVNEMNISFSKNKEIMVKHNNDRGWDFTLAPLKDESSKGGVLGTAPRLEPGHGGSGGGGGGGGGVAPGPGGSMFGRGMMPGGPMAPAGLDKGRMPLSMGAMAMGLPGPGPVPGLPGAGVPTIMPAGGSPVVLVRGFQPGAVTPDDLFTLFGVYGDIIRVKIMYKHRDTALIQYRDPSGAERAVQFLHGATLFGHPLRVSKSSNFQIKLPNPTETNPDIVQLTKDFSTSTMHRYVTATAAAKILRNISAPTKMLHLSNIPEGTTEAELRQLFQTYGTVTKFKWMENYSNMALLKMSTVDEATTALTKLHAHNVRDRKLRVCFSRSVIRDGVAPEESGDQGFC